METDLIIGGNCCGCPEESDNTDYVIKCDDVELTDDEFIEVVTGREILDEVLQRRKGKINDQQKKRLKNTSCK